MALIFSNSLRSVGSKIAMDESTIGPSKIWTYLASKVPEGTLVLVLGLVLGVAVGSGVLGIDPLPQEESIKAVTMRATSKRLGVRI
tara:strand:- start:382 stop:639 length:258 start_codon:yes stop_codon:yes gene_type:complete